MRHILATAVVATITAVPAQAAARGPDAELAALLEGRVAEPPVRCISVSPNMGSTRIVTGRAIIWRSGGRLYVNVPRGRADTLDDDDILITEPFGSQLCRNDQVRPLNRLSHIPRAALLLGDFTPYVRRAAK